MKKAAILGVASLFAIFIGLFAAATAGAGVYMNYFPEDITIQEGDPLDVPLFFECGSCAGKPVEIFVWKQDQTSGITEYLSQNEWVQFEDSDDVPPLVSIGSMFEYANFVWRVFDDTSGMKSFDLGICIDATMRGHVTENADCAKRAVIIEERDDPPPPTCSGLTVNPVSISKTLTRGDTETVRVSVANSCGPVAEFNASTSLKGIVLAKQSGILDVELGTSSLTPGSYSGTINVSSGGASAQVSVTLKVLAPVFNIGGGTCTPSSMSLWPNPVALSAASGEQVTETVTVKNNCGSVLSYSSSVTQGSNWLSASPSGNGVLTLTANTNGLQAGSYSGQVHVSAGGYSASLNVGLTVAGECTPDHAVLTPSSISQSAIAGQNASGVSVKVRDNCGASLDYTVNSVSASYTPATGGSLNWIIAPAANAQGTDTLSVTFNTSNLPAGSYTGSISVTPSLGGTKTIPVSITVSSSNNNGSVQEVKNGSMTYFDLQGKGVKYFKYMSTVPGDKDVALQIGLANQYTQNGTNSDMIIKYAGQNCQDGLPTLSDYDLVKAYVAANGNSSWLSTRNVWYPVPRAREDLYYRLSEDSFEFVEIFDRQDDPTGCYYIMVVNTLSSKETYVRLTIGDLHGPW
jgi:hypothetical protein